MRKYHDDRPAVAGLSHNTKMAIMLTRWYAEDALRRLTEESDLDGSSEASRRLKEALKVLP